MERIIVSNDRSLKFLGRKIQHQILKAYEVKERY